MAIDTRPSPFANSTRLGHCTSSPGPPTTTILATPIPSSRTASPAKRSSGHCFPGHRLVGASTTNASPDSGTNSAASAVPPAGTCNRMSHTGGTPAPSSSASIRSTVCIARGVFTRWLQKSHEHSAERRSPIRTAAPESHAISPERNSPWASKTRSYRLRLIDPTHRRTRSHRSEAKSFPRVFRGNGTTSERSGWASIASRNESCTNQSIRAPGYARRRLTSSGTDRQTSPKALGRTIKM